MDLSKELTDCRVGARPNLASHFIIHGSLGLERDVLVYAASTCSKSATVRVF